MAAAIAPVAQTYSVRVCSASARKGILVLLLAQLLGLFKQVSPASAHSSVGKLEGEELQRALRSLEGLCVDNLLSQEWWTYRWCFGKDAQQIHLDRISGEVAQSFSLGAHVPEESSLDHHILRDSSQSCNHRRKSEELHLSRYTEVSLECCEDEINDTKRFGRLTKYQRHSDEGSLIHNLDVVASAGNTHTYIAKVTEPVPCSYYITICSSLVCADHSPRFTTVPSTSGDSVAIRSSSLKEATPHSRLSSSSGTKPTSLSHSSPVHRLPTREEQLQMRERVRSMFHHAYDSYMTYAFPEAELKPISCEGGRFDLVKIPMVTLIDSLDTLVVMGNYTEFRAAVELVTFHLGKNQFNFDANVSVFETTIRVLGGLLSAHLMAIDPQLSIYVSYTFSLWLSFSYSLFDLPSFLFT